MKAFPELKDFSEVRAKYPLERVGWGGVRRVCYKIGETGFCVKFYKTKDIFETQRSPRAKIMHECEAKRFDLKRNNSAQEVRVYERYMRTMPKSVTSKLPEVVELVFDPECFDESSEAACVKSRYAVLRKFMFDMKQHNLIKYLNTNPLNYDEPI